MDLTPRSLAARLTLSSAIVLPIVLAFSAFALNSAFRNSLVNAERQSLQAQLYSLMGAAEPALADDPEGSSLYLPEEMTEPRFNRPQSGLYGLVLQADGTISWRSTSAPPDLDIYRQDRKDLLADMATGNERFLELNLGRTPYFVLMFDSLWEVRGQDQVFRFLVLHRQTEFQQELNSYREVLWLWLGGMALLFIAAQYSVTRWGLKPLKHLAQELKKFQQGQNRQLEGQYPTEISPVIDNLNELLESEQTQRQRYKNTLSDLAHSLKTPLAIVRAELESQQQRNDQVIDEQVTRMADIIQHQLQRATLTTTSSIREKTHMGETLERLSAALQKVYREKQFAVELTVAEELHFPGDESDALEVFGNLLENAFKYGRSQIRVRASTDGQELKVAIEDDGPGVPGEMKKQILTRGARADTTAQGQGIGLAIVVDILSSYRAQLSVDDSDLGGARFNLSIPLQAAAD